MDDLQDYLKEREERFMGLVQRTGKAQAQILHARDRLCDYISGLSPDAVARPEFIRSIREELNGIISMLGIE